MMVATFHPEAGWSAPEIKPYGPLTLDPASSCFQYCTSIFEGMKVISPVSIFFLSLYATSASGLPRTGWKAAPIQAKEEYGKDRSLRRASSFTCESL